MKTSTKLWQNSKVIKLPLTRFIKTKSHILIPQLCCSSRIKRDQRTLNPSHRLPLFGCFTCLRDTKVTALLWMKASPKGCWVRDKNQCLQAVRRFAHGFLKWRFVCRNALLFPSSQSQLLQWCVIDIVIVWNVRRTDRSARFNAWALPRQMCFIRERPRFLS